jgi:hypothetical protein
MPYVPRGIRMELFKLLQRCAREGFCCPTSAELVAHLRCPMESLAQQFKALADHGLIAVRVTSHGRNVTIPATEETTSERTSREQLGIPGASLDHGGPAASRARKRRPCLNCGRFFMSEGWHHRRCGCPAREGFPI